MCLQKGNRKGSCREDYYQSCCAQNLADAVAVHMKFGKYVQDQVVIVKVADGPLHFSVDLNTV